MRPSRRRSFSTLAASASAQSGMPRAAGSAVSAAVRSSSGVTHFFTPSSSTQLASESSERMPLVTLPSPPVMSCRTLPPLTSNGVILVLGSIILATAAVPDIFVFIR